MDDLLKRALAGDYEERPFHGATVRIRHFSANERLELVAKYGENVTPTKAVEFYTEVVTLAVAGVDAADVPTLRDASFPRFEELAKLALSVNKMGGSDVDTLAGN